eukprot:6546474-Lingulodinium_polyedra.AAC.1
MRSKNGIPVAACSWLSYSLVNKRANTNWGARHIGLDVGLFRIGNLGVVARGGYVGVRRP